MARLKKREPVPINKDVFEPRFFGKARRSQRGRGTDENQNLWSNLSGELENVGKGVSPLNVDTTGSVSAKDAICLCQKAYWNIAIFRNTIDIQTEFSNSHIQFRGKNKRSVKFFETWYKKIGGKSLAEKFFREWFRSGNVFVYKFYYELPISEINKMARAASREIPLRYVILNPADIRCEGSASFIDAVYGKVLNSYELARLKSDKITEEEQRFLDSLPREIVDKIKKGEKPLIPINPENLVAVFCGKQDYEGLAIPMYYPVLFDIDLKLEFKKMEKVIARTADYMILLITAGDKDRDANTNSRILNELQSLFEVESVGRVLVSDFSTKADFILPDLSKILGADKYKVVNEDIANGLMNIFWGEEKFANSMVKIKVFLERLNAARESYLNNFLIPEMEKIAKNFGFTEIPEPIFNEIDLKDEIEYIKAYTRLAELGVLTPSELFNALETNILPIPETSVESQEEFKKLKDKGLYEPLIGGKKEDPAGRPTGTKAPQKTKKVGPIGGSKFSLQKISESVKAAETLVEKVEDAYRKINSIKRLSNKQKDICWKITEEIISCKNQSEWESCIEEFINNPIQEPAEEALEIAAVHDISLFLAGILKESKL